MVRFGVGFVGLAGVGFGVGIEAGFEVGVGVKSLPLTSAF
ncbi:hypothetical protein AGMMS50233_09630 [Endomicrobiia bacterium]|nr:hypothetical protein AGMMS50233_09630 [Endomicrobiia bacterium]